jgi:hypothetical protein
VFLYAPTEEKVRRAAANGHSETEARDGESLTLKEQKGAPE